MLNNIDGSDKYNLYYANETCCECGKQFVKINDIRVSVDSDLYFCVRCSKELHVETSECRGF